MKATRQQQDYLEVLGYNGVTPLEKVTMAQATLLIMDLKRAKAQQEQVRATMATFAQKKYLQQLRYLGDLDSLTKQRASELIDRFRAYPLATDSQREFLKDLGYDGDISELSKADASAITTHLLLKRKG